MNPINLEDFSPPEDTPLVVSFVEMAKSAGLTTQIAWEYWDFYVYAQSDDPIIAVRTVKNRIHKDTLGRLLADKTPFKVILVDGDRPDYDHLRSQRMFLASAGAGVYVRDVGWLTKPHEDVREDVEDLRLKMSKRWKRDQYGIWRKKCTTCGEIHGIEGFYPSANATARDPYRNICKDCWRFDSKAAYLTRKEA